jgi:hypothetical protein
MFPRLAATASILVASLAAPATAGVCDTSSAAPYYCKGERNYGNSDFAAGYAIRGGLVTKKHYTDAFTVNNLPVPLNYAALPADYVWIGAGAQTQATLFGKTKELFELVVAGEHQNGAASARVLTRIGGKTLVDRRYTSVTAVFPLFGVGFSASKQVSLGFTSIDIEASAIIGGAIGLAFSGGSSKVSLTATPSLGATAGISVELDAGCSVGIDASLTLVSVGVPVTASLDLAQIAQKKIGFGLGADLEIKALEGGADLEVACAGIYEDSFEIVSFDGWRFVFDLFDIQPVVIDL